jgi:AcrR family transcriptional regulator
MDGFERRKEQKKEVIVRAALELFQTYGFKKASVNEIAHRAGVSQVTIYNHFGSKEGLVREVVKKLYLDILERFKKIIRGDRPFLEKLETIVFDKTQLAGQYQGELLQEALSRDPEIQQFTESIWQKEVNQLMIDLFDEGKKQGYIDQQLSREAIMLYLDIMRKGVFNSPGLPDEIKRNPELAGELTSLFIYGLNG